MNLDKWKKNSWKIAAGGVLGLLLIKFAILPLVQTVYENVGTTTKKSASAGQVVSDFFSVVPLWLYIVGPIVITIVIMVMRDGKTPNEKVKKVVDLFMALTKLAMFVAIFLFFLVFIIGPREFWGSYEMSPEVAAMAPSRQTQTGGANGIRYPSPPDRNEINIAVPIGTLQTPLTNWSEPLILSGRSSEFLVRGPNGENGVTAINADGIILVIGPEMEPNIGKPNVLRFLSLTNFHMTVKGKIY